MQQQCVILHAAPLDQLAVTGILFWPRHNALCPLLKQHMLLARTAKVEHPAVHLNLQNSVLQLWHAVASMSWHPLCIAYTQPNLPVHQGSSTLCLPVVVYACLWAADYDVVSLLLCEGARLLSAALQ
jgi:hypothetical protein